MSENEPTAGGSSLSLFQSLRGSQVRISGLINGFLLPGFVLYFCRRDFWRSLKGLLLDLKESFGLGHCWWCQVCPVPSTEDILLASLEECLRGCREQRCSRRLGYNEDNFLSVLGTMGIPWIMCDDQNDLSRILKQDYKALTYCLWNEPINCSV